MLNAEQAKKILRNADFFVDNAQSFAAITNDNYDGKCVYVSFFDYSADPAQHWGTVSVREEGGVYGKEPVLREEIKGAYLLERLVLRAIELKADLAEAVGV
jgi:hypothetical protein